MSCMRRLRKSEDFVVGGEQLNLNAATILNPIFLFIDAGASLTLPAPQTPANAGSPRSPRPNMISAPRVHQLAATNARHTLTALQNPSVSVRVPTLHPLNRDRLSTLFKHPPIPRQSFDHKSYNSLPVPSLHDVNKSPPQPSLSSPSYARAPP